MEIRKVKSANGVITIRAKEQSGEDDVRRIELESRAEPRPEFHEAMGGLISPAMNMIQAPPAWLDVATISSVSLTHEEERGMGAVVTILVPLECAPSPLVINTPYLCSEDPNGSGAPILPTDLCKAVIRVIDEALRYLDGDRAQGDLFAGRTTYDSGVRSFAERPEHVPVDKSDENGIVVEAVPAGQEDRTVRYAIDKDPEQPVAEPEPLADGPIRDRPPHEVHAEFERIRTEAMRKQPVIKPARGRRAGKVAT